MTKRRSFVASGFAGFAPTMIPFTTKKEAIEETSNSESKKIKNQPLFLSDFLPNFVGVYIILPLSGVKWRVDAVEAVLRGSDDAACCLNFCVEDVNGAAHSFAEIIVTSGASSKKLLEDKPVIEPCGIASRSLSVVVSATLGEGDIYLAVSGSTI